MHYRWHDFNLDREAGILTRRGQRVQTSEKALECIAVLIEQRHRVVSYDELIHRLWGRDDVSNNQLAQVIVAARRSLGDDGELQQMIRTVAGHGYRWLAPVSDDVEADIAPEAPTPHPESSAQDAEIAPPTDIQVLPDASAVESPAASARTMARMTPRWAHRRVLVISAVALAVTVLAFMFWPTRDDRPAIALQPASQDPIAGLWQALWKGQFEAVEKGLAALPENLSDTADARFLEIYLDTERGMFERAARQLRSEQTRAAASADPVRKARLFSAEALLNGWAGKSGEQVLAPAQSAVRLLESAGASVPPRIMGEALSARGYGFMKTRQYEPAVQDLVMARDLLLTAGDMHGAAVATDTLARVQMRTERFTEALELFKANAETCQESGLVVQEIYARLGATRIQIEQLRWKGALADSDRTMQLLQAVPNTERRARALQLRVLVLSGVGRLREAAARLKELEALNDDRYSTIAAATHDLAAGRYDSAMVAASNAVKFDGYVGYDTLNLESKEGALLLWMMAAQHRTPGIVSLPSLSPSQLEVLQKRESTISRIALGRWFWSRGMQTQAEAELRLAFDAARKANRPQHMALAAEPLIDLLLQNGQIEAADAASTALRAIDPTRMDSDFQVSVMRLRIASAKGDIVEIENAYRKATALAGERKLPIMRESSRP